MTAVANNFGVSETWTDVEDLVHFTINQFQRRYPLAGDHEELLSQSHQIFMRAYRTYKRKNGKFSNWLRFLLWKILLEDVRRRSMRQARLCRVAVDVDTIGKETERFDIDEYAAEHKLSEDAKTVVRLTVDAPMEVLISLQQRGGKQSPRTVQASVREFLVDMGWSTHRVTESFLEISKALR